MTAVHDRPVARLATPIWAGAAAGTVAAGVGLGAGELFAGFSDSIPSLVVAIGELVIDRTPGDLVEAGIQASGTNDKPLLIAGIVTLSLVFGAVLGVVALHRRRLAEGGLVAFGVLGGWAAARNPFSSAPWAWIAAMSAALLAIATLRVLLAAAELPEGAVRLPDPDRLRPEPGRPRHTETTSESFEARPKKPDSMPGRRAFLTLGVGAGFFALGATAIGRELQRGRGIARIRDAVALPPPATVVDGPAAASAATLDGAVPGLTPFITPNPDFYRIDTALTLPQVDPADWRLAVTGLVDAPYELTYDEILAMDLVEVPVTLSCVSNEVGGRLVGNARWLGVPLTTLLDRARPQPEGTQIVGVSVDDFDAGFPTELAYDGRTALLAVGMNGEPLPVRNGFPARLVVSGLYGYVSAVKWITEIRVDTDEHNAYWVPRGWSKLGPVKTQSRIDVPRRGADLSRGTNAIAGVAWAPSVGIEAVEVRIDGDPWRLCRLGDTTTDDTWVQWLVEWNATPGRHTIEVRATDKAGVVQTAEATSPRPNGAAGHHRITVNVT